MAILWLILGIYRQFEDQVIILRLHYALLQHDDRARYIKRLFGESNATWVGKMFHMKHLKRFVGGDGHLMPFRMSAGVIAFYVESADGFLKGTRKLI